MGSVLEQQDGMPPKIMCPLLNFTRPVGSCMTRCEHKDVNWCQQIKKVPIEDLDAVVPLMTEPVSVEAWEERRDFFLEPVGEIRVNKDQPFDKEIHGGGGLLTKAELGEVEDDESDPTPPPAPAPEPNDDVEVHLGPHTEKVQRNVQRTSAEDDDAILPSFEEEGKTAEDKPDESTNPGTIPSVSRPTKKSAKKSSKKSKSKSKSKASKASETGEEEEMGEAGPTTMVIVILDTWCQVHDFEGKADSGALMQASIAFRKGLVSFHEEKYETLEEEGELQDEEGKEVSTLLERLQNEAEFPTRLFQVGAEFRTQVVTTLEQV